MKTITPNGGDQPRHIGRYTSVSEAARAMGTTRQQAKQIIRKAQQAYRIDKDMRKFERLEAQQ